MCAVVIAATAGVINPAAHGPDVVIGLGVGAAGSDQIIVKLHGKDTRVKLARVPGGSDEGRLFLQCLVTKRVVRVDPKCGRAWMLDEVEINETVRLYLENRGTADPCDAGKSAYVGPNDPLPVVQRKRT